MKQDIRKMLCAMSAVATLATMTTFFTGCNKKPKEDDSGVSSVEEAETPKAKEVSYTKVDKENVADLTLEKDKIGSRTNMGKAIFKLAKDKREELIKNAESTKSKMFDEFQIYQDKDGQYFIIDKDKAYSIVKSGDEYKLLEKEDSHYVLTGEKGNRYLVFGGEGALKAFTSELEKKLSDTEKVYSIVNGIFVGEAIDSIEVSRFDGTRTYYDFESVMKVVADAVEDGGYADPIEYTKEDDCFTVKRTFYTTDDAGNGTGSNEQSITVPIGEESDVYVDTSVNAFLGMTFQKDNKYWVSTETLINLLGIDIMEGEYTVPGTKTKVDAIMIDTSGSDEPKFVIQPSIKDNENPEITTNEEGIYDNSSDSPIIVEEKTEVQYEVIDDGVAPQEPADNSGSYDQEAYEKLGIKVNLHGTNEEQSKQYYDACVAAYPTLPWVDSGNGVSVRVDTNSIMDEVMELTPEETEARANEILGGRRYDEVTLEELYKAIPYFLMSSSDYASEAITYWDSKTNRQFNFDGWVAL